MTIRKISHEIKNVEIQAEPRFLFLIRCPILKYISEGHHFVTVELVPKIERLIATDTKSVGRRLLIVDRAVYMKTAQTQGIGHVQYTHASKQKNTLKGRTTSGNTENTIKRKSGSKKTSAGVRVKGYTREVGREVVCVYVKFCRSVYILPVASTSTFLFRSRLSFHFLLFALFSLSPVIVSQLRRPQQGSSVPLLLTIRWRRGGAHLAPLKQTNHLVCFGLCCRGQGGLHRASLRRIYRIGSPATGIAGGKGLLCVLLPNHVRVKTPRPVEAVQSGQTTVVQLIHHPSTTLTRLCSGGPSRAPSFLYTGSRSSGAYGAGDTPLWYRT